MELNSLGIINVKNQLNVYYPVSYYNFNLDNVEKGHFLNLLLQNCIPCKQFSPKSLNMFYNKILSTSIILFYYYLITNFVFFSHFDHLTSHSINLAWKSLEIKLEIFQLDKPSTLAVTCLFPQRLLEINSKYIKSSICSKKWL